MGRKISLEQAFADALKQARKRTDYSQEGLAHDAGLDRTYISLLERGLRNPSLRTVFKLASLLQTTPSELVREVEKKEISL